MSENETRQAILQCILGEVALHKSELCRQVGRAWGTVSHHLRVLEESGRIELESHGKNTWIFPAELPQKERLRRMVLSAPERRDLLRLLADRDATVGQLSSELDASKKVVRTHLSHLVSAGYVEKGQDDPNAYRVRRPKDQNSDEAR